MSALMEVEMKAYSANEIRNISILGHSGCGKTTLAEVFLNLAGYTTRIGRVEDGNTVSDYDAEEARRRVSVSASMIPVEWKNSKLNIIDVPGYFDFVGEQVQALRVSDVAMIVISGKSGVEVGAEKAWEYAEVQQVPRLIYVNSMDDENADFDRVIEELQEKFGKAIAPVQIPVRDGNKLVGFIDAVKKQYYRYNGSDYVAGDLPAAYEDALETMHMMICEAVAETSDELMEKFLEETPFTVEEIQQGIKDGIANNAVAPVFCGSATQNLGVKTLLDSIVEYVPTAAELCKKVTAKDEDGKDVEVICAENAPFSAFVFKTIADPYVGRMSLFRVYSGVLRRDTPMYNVKKDTMEKVSQLYLLRGKEQIPVDELRAGDIGAIAKLAVTQTQDTLCVKEKAVLHTDIVFPESLYQMVIMPKGKGDEDKIASSVIKLLEEDKTLRFDINAETKQAIVSGMGDNHLDVLLQKIRQRYKLEALFVDVIVPYRELIKGKSTVTGTHKKQSGGHGQYGVVVMEFEPSGEMDKPYVFEERIFGGSVPRQYFPAVEKGIQECVKTGPLAGYPVVGLKAVLIDGKYHDVDSSEMAFKIATSLAFRDGFMKAKPTLLEPIAKVEVTVPDDYTGDIMGDMNKRRGRIMGMSKVGTKQVISAEVPLAEMFKYALDLRSMTQGRGSFTMKFDRYEEAPADVQARVIEERKREREAEK